MRYIELEGKKYALKGRFGEISKLLSKYDVLKLKEGGWGDDDKIYINFVLESAWRLIQPIKFFKPYVFFRRFKKQVVFSEIMAAQKNILAILYGIPDDIDTDEEQEKKTMKTKAS